MNYQKHSQVNQISANPLARYRASIFWIMGAALILGLLLAVSGSAASTASASSHAGSMEIVSVTLDGGAPWVPNIPDDELSVGGGVPLVGPGDSVDVVITEVNGAWAATEWVFGNSGDPGTFACVSSPDHPVYTGSATNPREAKFSVTTPSGTVPGTYDLARIHR